MKDPIEILRQYNRWRRGEDVDFPVSYEIDEAIDRVIAEVELRRRGECICIRCGIRQNGEKTEVAF